MEPDMQKAGKLKRVRPAARTMKKQMVGMEGRLGFVRSGIMFFLPEN